MQKNGRHFLKTLRCSIKFYLGLNRRKWSVSFIFLMEPGRGRAQNPKGEPWIEMFVHCPSIIVFIIVRTGNLKEKNICIPHLDG